MSNRFARWPVALAMLLALPVQAVPVPRQTLPIHPFPRCMTDVRRSIEESRRLTDVAPAPLMTPATRPSISPALVLIDGSCDGDRCPATRCKRGMDNCWLQHYLDTPVYEVDTFAAASRFYAEYPDRRRSGWDEVIFFTTFVSTFAGGAYYMPISNDVSGLARSYMGVASAEAELFDLNLLRRTGSSGYLKGTVLMHDWHTCKSAQLLGLPCSLTDGSQRGVLGVLGQEVGHRWGAFLHFKERSRASSELLGRDTSHWSYYVDTGGSPLEGNRWVAASDGGWELAKVESLQFSPLDLYTMGALPPEEVPATLLIRSPSPTPCSGDSHVMPDPNETCTNASSAPAEGATRVSGTAREVTMDEIVEAEGPRSPAFPEASRIVHLAFALIELPEAQASEEEQRTLENLRRTFTRAFYDGTRRRMRAITTLTRADDLGLFDFTLDSEGWTLSDGLRVADGMVVMPLGAPALITHTNLELDSTWERVLHLRVSTTRQADVALRLRWSAAPIGAWNEISVPVPATGALTTLEIPMGSLPGWGGSIQRMEIEAVANDAPAGAEVLLDRVETALDRLAVDQDGDYVPDSEDNCPTAANTDQHDDDANGVGDACDEGSGGDLGCGCSGGASAQAIWLALVPVMRRRRRSTKAA